MDKYFLFSHKQKNKHKNRNIKNRYDSNNFNLHEMRFFYYFHSILPIYSLLLGSKLKICILLHDKITRGLKCSNKLNFCCWVFFCENWKATGSDIKSVGIQLPPLLFLVKYCMEFNFNNQKVLMGFPAFFWGFPYAFDQFDLKETFGDFEIQSTEGN